MLLVSFFYVDRVYVASQHDVLRSLSAQCDQVSKCNVLIVNFT